MRVHVLDLETTGLDPRVDRILEVGIVRLEDGVPVAEFHALVNPGVPLRPSNIAIHGITPEMVREAPALPEVLDDVMGFLGSESLVVGHNIAFDAAFLNAALLRLRGVPFALPVLDTQVWAREVFPREKALSVERLVQLFDLPFRGFHRALADARALAAVYPLLERAYEERLDWYRSRYAEREALATRYLGIQKAMDDLRAEEFAIRRTLERYLEESGAPEVEAPGEARFRVERRESVEFQADELKEILLEAGHLSRVCKVDKVKLERLLRSERLTDDQQAAILATRRILSVRQQLVVERLESGGGPCPSMPTPI